MKAIMIHEGAAIDYTPTSAVSAGDVIVQTDLIGIAKLPIAANTLGALAIEGVFDVVKTNVAVNAGQMIYWDAANQYATTSSSGTKYMGKAVRAAAAGDARVRVKLSP
jgi:predicted RecA/RadA family phage recombinase